MGIKHLHQLLEEFASSSIKSYDIDHYFGRKVAIDASMSIYQFLVAVRQKDGQQLMNKTGETTSHLMGIFYRTLRMCDNGIRLVFKLAKRTERREKALKSYLEAKEADSVEDMNKFSRRTVYAAASEDMDILCFSSPILLRHLTFSEQRKEPITEVNLEKALKELEMSLEQFVDLCILLGCDYCEPIKGVGPKRALELIREYKSLDVFVNSADKSKYHIPENWPYKDARELFLKPDITNPETFELKWESPDAEGLFDFLVKEKGFSEERVNNGIARLEKTLKSAQQIRLDGFFKENKFHNLFF
ncbi:hypothetical protein PMAC_003301 [Pneumocystis sp. 'macacae']|nr:hypothetical protein PMAC_003301 [Pneumocystis sp. 'macacae']